jgi:hypothetical protein
MGMNDTPEVPVPPEFDDEGGELPVAPRDSDVGQLIYLLEWARIRGFRVGPTVQVGELIVQITDLRQDEGRRSDPPDPGPWAAAGHVEEGDR